MNSKSQLQTLGRRQRVFVAAFGKHPGWDDHIESLGLETAALIETRRTLYLEGVGKNLDSGAWDQLSERHRIKSFHHAFVSITGEGVVSGRMWSSLDGKGRSRYPMVVCAQGVGTPLPQFLDVVDSGLESIEAQCRDAMTASEVKGILEKAPTTLQDAIASLDEKGTAGKKGEEASNLSLFALIESTGMAEPREGLMRILYQIERDLSAYMQSSRAAKAERKQPKHFRVPACGDNNRASFMLWIAILRSLLSGPVPLLLLRPIGYPWVDIIVGEAKAPQLYCLRTTLEAIPLVSDVPYNLGASFRERTEAWLNAWESGALDLQQLLLGAGRNKHVSACTSPWKQRLDQIKAIFVKE